MEELRVLLAPHYVAIKALHVLAAAIWAFSTAVAWAFYLKPAFRRVERRPDDTAAREIRNRMMEAFDAGAVFEHVAFVVLVATSGLMLWLGRFDLTAWSYVTAKVWLGILVILPMEIVDIYLAHGGGNKSRLRRAGDMAGYERMMGWHWVFLRVTEPVVIVLVPAMIFLAVAKPF